MKKEKKQRQFNESDLKEINGEKYVKFNSMAELDGLMLDNFHLEISRREIKIAGRKCFKCGKDFKGKIDDLTCHHALPKSLKPIYNVKIPLCDSCHKELNLMYVRYPETTTKQTPKDFVEFKKNYEELRSKFHEKKLDRGRFGEALWTNLMNFLEKISNEKENTE